MKRILVISLMVLFISAAAMGREAVLFDGTGKTPEERLIAMTVAGIVNRSEPRLFLMNVYETWSWNETDERWRSIYETDGGVTFTVISDVNQLVQYFRSYLKGAITYDRSLTYSNFAGQSFRWQAEVAAMMGGLADCIPVPYDDYSVDISRPDSVLVPDIFNGKQPARLSARLDNAVHPWNNTSMSQEQRYYSILEWALDTLLDRSNTNRFYLREITDWAISQRMFQLYMAGTEDLRFTSLSDAKAAMIERVMTYLRESKPGVVFHVFGWMRPEPRVQWISSWGGSFHETLMGNLSWHHIFPGDAGFDYRRNSDIDPRTVLLENKHYVLFISSEGDAGNWTVGFQGGAWFSASRGEVPVGWGFNLHLFEQFPFLAQYYYRTAKANDGFVASITPLGYAYPDVFPSAFITDAASRTSGLMTDFRIHTVYGYKHYNGAGTSDYRGITISNNFSFFALGTFAAQTDILLNFVYDPALATQTAYTGYGGLIYNHVNDATFYADVSNLATASERIVNKLKGKPRPSFLLAGYQRFRNDAASISSSNPADITIPRLKTIMENVKANAEVGQYVEFVTPEKFTYLLRIKMGLMTGTEKLDEGSSQLQMYLSGGMLKIILPLQQPQDLSLRIYDLTGRLICDKPWKMSVSNEGTTVDVSSLMNGMYIVSVSGNGVCLTGKFIR